MNKTINKIKKDHGFTIVELLVVIVVIGILAAITIVSYTGITARANTSKAQSNAQSAQNIAEVYATDSTANSNYYPATAAAFMSYAGSAKLPSSITVVPGFPGTSGAFTGTMSTLWGTTITSANFATTVTWACLTSCTNPTGGRITYYDFSTGTQSTTVLYVGAGSVAGTYVAPAS